MTTQEATTTTTITPPIPNWRVLSLSQESEHDFDKYVTNMSAVDSTWNETQYQQSLELYESLWNCEDSYVAPLIKEALNTLDHAYRLYGPHSVVCSFNGGKDAVVILHLMRAAHAHYYNETTTTTSTKMSPCRPRVIYFEHKDEFPQVLDLLHKTTKEFDLNMLAFECGTKFSHGLEVLVQHNIPPGSGATTIKFPMAFVLGTRTTDPNAGSQGQFAPSSHYMPPFMRVNPVLDWTYGHVWHFLRLYKLQYCSLYDEGYTSLGTTKDTLPCPALAVAGSSPGVPKYWPAYMLRDWDQERAGRTNFDANKKDTKKKKRIVKRKDTVPESVLSAYTTITELAGNNNNTSAVNSEDVSSSVAPISDPSDVGLETNSTASSFSSLSQQRSVGLLVIGDEILKGFTADTNTQAAAVALRENNVLLSRVAVVSDDPDEIVAEIARMQHEVDVIVTSGGVGPTHDDVTLKSVATALGKEMVRNDEMAGLIQDKMNDTTNSLLDKMATLPASSKLRYLSEDTEDWPVLQCCNVFVLPGVPQFFEKKINNLAEYLSSQLERSITYKVVLSVDEASIVDILNAAVERHSHVSFGSYPFVSHPEFKTVVTLEGRMIAGSKRRNSSLLLDRKNSETSIFSKAQMDGHVREALDSLINDLPEGSILRVDNNDGVFFS